MTTVKAMSDYIEGIVISLTFRTGANITTAPKLALFTTNPTDANTGTEVSRGGYVRQPLPLFTKNGTYFQNSVKITFPEATENWGIITHIGIMSATTGGSLYFHAQLERVCDMQEGDIFEIGVGKLRVSLYGAYGSEYIKDKFLNLLLNANYYTFNDPLTYLGLLTNSGEVSGKNYARKKVEKSQWSETVEETEEGGHLIYNTNSYNSVVFNKASDDWGEITRVGIYDAATGGHCIYIANLKYPQYIDDEDRIKFPSKTLRIMIT